jgi:thioredoxin-related protein
MISRRMQAGLAAVLLAGSASAIAAEKVFNPTRDAGADLQQAETQAKAEGKNILLDVGGNWCPWCLVLDRTLANDAGLHALLEKKYVVVHVNFSKENQKSGVSTSISEAEGISGLVRVICGWQAAEDGRHE